MSDYDIDPGTVEPPFDDEQFEDVPTEPETDPIEVFGKYEVHAPDPWDGPVPTWILIVEYPDDLDVYLRKWVFAGKQGFMVFKAYQRHRYGGDKKPPQIQSQRKDCCLKIELRHGLRAEHCPDEVRDIVARISDAPTVSLNERDHEADAAE